MSRRKRASHGAQNARGVTTRELITALASLALFSACQRAPAAPTGPSCRIESVRALSNAPDERPIGLIEHSGTAVVLSVMPDGDHVIARLRRVNGEHVEQLASTPVAREAAVSNLAATPNGPGFATATATSVTAHVATDRGVRHTAFPRGEPPAGRESIVPALAFTHAHDGAFEALSDFGPRFGIHRIHTRDVGESVGYTPVRQDVFAAPSIAINGNLALLVQQRRIGTFIARGTTHTQLETLGLPSDPIAIHIPTSDPIEPDASPAWAPRVAAMPGSPDGPIALIAWRAGDAIYRANVTRRAARPGSPPIATSRPVRIVDVPESAAAPMTEEGSRSLGAPAITVLPGRCGSLIAWVAPHAERRAVRIVRVDSDTAAVAWIGARDSAAIDLDTGTDDPRLEMATLGNRTIVAAQAAGKISALEVTIDATCNARVRPTALPIAMRSGRLLGVVAEAQRMVLATGVRDGDGTQVSFVTFEATGAPRTLPAARRVESDARALGLLANGVVVIAGRAPRGIRIDRFAGSSANEEDEDLVIRGSGGAEFVMIASAAHHRIWVAEALDTGNTLFGPAQTVVLHSVIETLEDGPRTEVHTAIVPSADFGRITLDSVWVPAVNGLSAPAWATTFSRGEGSQDGCLAGAFVALFNAADDHLMAPRAPGTDAAWPGTTALSEAASRTCMDRVGGVVWDGPRFVLTLSGPIVGIRLVHGDASAGSSTSVVLEGIPNDAVLAGFTRVGDDYAVAWASVRSDGASALRARLFRVDGHAAGPIIDVADTAIDLPVLGASMGSVPLAAMGVRQFGAAYPSRIGPQLARVVCTPRP